MIDIYIKYLKGIYYHHDFYFFDVNLDRLGEPVVFARFLLHITFPQLHLCIVVFFGRDSLCMAYSKEVGCYVLPS